MERESEIERTMQREMAKGRERDVLASSGCSGPSGREVCN